MTFIALVPEIYFNVKQYGAAGDGSTDDTTAINNTITAAAGGGYVFFPPGTYKITGSIIMSNGYTILLGSGYNTVIQPAAGALYDAIRSPLPTVVGTSGFVRNYLGIENLMIDCTNMTGTTAGKGNAIHWYGVRYSYIEKVFIKSSPNWAILLDGDNTSPGFNFGYDNKVTDCIFDLCAGNVYQTNCEANDFRDNRFKWCGGTTAAAQPLFGATDTTGMHLRLGSGYAYVAGNVFGTGGSYTTEAIRCSNSGPCRIIGNRFDQVHSQAVVLNAGNHEFAFNALGSPGSSITGVPAIQIGSSNNRVCGNSFDTTAGGANYTYAIAESGGPFSNNVISDNLLIAGTAGLISQNATSTNKVHHNPPNSPVGSITAPGFPATTVGVQNTTGYDVTAYVANGTSNITVIQIAGASGTYVTTGRQITASAWGSVRLPAGASVKFTYAGGAPSWTWFAD